MNDAPIPTSRVAAFIRQHTHDVRNTINCMDLEMELMQDLVVEEDVAAGMTRVREQLRQIERHMKALSAAFQEPRPTLERMSPKVLWQVWQEKQQAYHPQLAVQWRDELGPEPVAVEVDLALLGEVFTELLTNATAYPPAGPLIGTLKLQDQRLALELQEPKETAVEPQAWGLPFARTAHGHYSLGLWAARRKLEALGGQLEQSFDAASGSLVTTLSLPVKN